MSKKKFPCSGFKWELKWFKRRYFENRPSVMSQRALQHPLQDIFWEVCKQKDYIFLVEPNNKRNKSKEAIKQNIKIDPVTLWPCRDLLFRFVCLFLDPLGVSGQSAATFFSEALTLTLRLGVLTLARRGL